MLFHPTMLLRKILKLDKTPRTIEGIDIAHLAGEDKVASLVNFIDGLPFKPGYRRYRIRTVEVGFRATQEKTETPLGWSSTHGNNANRLEEEALMITGDGNLVELQATTPAAVRPGARWAVLQRGPKRGKVTDLEERSASLETSIVATTAA